MKLKLKCKKTSTKPIRCDVQNINEECTIEVKNKFRAPLLDIDEKEPDEIANETKKIYIETAEKHLSKKSVKNKHG